MLDFQDEKIFKGERELKYLFRPYDSPYLVVIFSGFSKINSPPLYNYVKSTANIKANKLFILDDFGPEHLKGSYYLCERKDYAIERSVIDLITCVQKLNNIPPSNVITCGSSKGGFASLYYGIKYGFGKVVSGGPQILLGNYLCKEISVTKPVAEYISGGLSKSHIHYLNKVMPRTIKKARSFPALYIHVGKGEPHYERHVAPLVSVLKKKKVEPVLDLAEYNDHSELVKHFPPYLLATLEKIISESETKAHGA